MAAIRARLPCRLKLRLGLWLVHHRLVDACLLDLGAPHGFRVGYPFHLRVDCVDGVPDFGHVFKELFPFRAGWFGGRRGALGFARRLGLPAPGSGLRSGLGHDPVKVRPGTPPRDRGSGCGSGSGSASGSGGTHSRPSASATIWAAGPRNSASVSALLFLRGLAGPGDPLGLVPAPELAFGLPGRPAASPACASAHSRRAASATAARRAPRRSSSARIPAVSASASRPASRAACARAMSRLAAPVGARRSRR